MFRALRWLSISMAVCFAGPGLANAANGYVFPLKVSSNHRYLVDQKGVPFMMVGDAPQAMVGNLSPLDANLFMANRAKYGINTLWVNLLCDSYTACNTNGTTFDGIAPFTAAGDLATPTEIFRPRRQDGRACGEARDGAAAGSG